MFISSLQSNLLRNPVEWFDVYFQLLFTFFSKKKGGTLSVIIKKNQEDQKSFHAKFLLPETVPVTYFRKSCNLLQSKPVLKLVVKDSRKWGYFVMKLLRGI